MNGHAPAAPTTTRRCDCGCGVIDPDCANGSAASCAYCDDLGSCSYAGCPGQIDAGDNSTCD